MSKELEICDSTGKPQARRLLTKLIAALPWLSDNEFFNWSDVVSCSSSKLFCGDCLMREYNPVSSIAVLFLLTLCAFGQAAPNSKNGLSGSLSELNPGVAVEKIAKDSEAEKAGMQTSDIIIAWARGDAGSQIESPFDLLWLELEQKPRGRVTLEGLRGTEPRTWILGPDTWGIQARPNFVGSFLSIYQDGMELAKSGKVTQGVAHWRTAEVEAQRSQPPWLPVWFSLRAAQLLANAQQRNEADALYQDSIEQATHADSHVLAYLLWVRAALFEQRSDRTNAETYYQRALTESRKSGSETLIAAENLTSLGSLSWRRGDLVRAEEYHLQAMVIREKLAPGSLVMANSLTNLGYVSADRGDLAAAEDYLRQALEIREKIAPGSWGISGTLEGLGSVAGQRGALMRAEDYLRRSLAIREKLAAGGTGVASALGNLGNVLFYRGDLDKAEDY